MKVTIFSHVLIELKSRGIAETVMTRVYGRKYGHAIMVFTASAEKAEAAGWAEVGALTVAGEFMPFASGDPGEHDGGNGVEIKIETDYYGKLTSRTSSILKGMLVGKRVGFVGVGASINLVKSCVRSGVEKFSLWDLDIVEEANLGRTAYELEDCGLPKTHAARRHILGINPFCDVKVFNGDFMARPAGEISKEFGECDVVVMGTDAQKVQLKGNEIGYALGKKMVFPGFYDKAAGGEIVVVTPGGPCYKCIVPSRFGAAQAVYAEKTAGAADLRGESGLIFDCDHLDSMVGKIVCALLCENGSNELRGLYEFVKTHGLILSKHASDFKIDGEDYFRDCLGDNPLFYAYQTMWLDTSESGIKGCEICKNINNNNDF